MPNPPYGEVNFTDSATSAAPQTGSTFFEGGRAKKSDFPAILVTRRDNLYTNSRSKNERAKPLQKIDLISKKKTEGHIFNRFNHAGTAVKGFNTTAKKFNRKNPVLGRIPSKDNSL